MADCPLYGGGFLAEQQHHAHDSRCDYENVADPAFYVFGESTVLCIEQICKYCIPDVRFVFAPSQLSDLEINAVLRTSVTESSTGMRVRLRTKQIIFF